MLIDENKAKELAGEELSQLEKEGLFTQWSNASIGAPVMVRNLFKEPSYWLVPVLILDKLAGFIRVLGSGKVAHIGTFYRDAKNIDGPSVITGIVSTEASKRAAERIHIGESASAPCFIHDGPIGREAWLVEVIKDGKPTRWIFVTPAFVYERPAGEMLNETLE